MADQQFPAPVEQNENKEVEQKDKEEVKQINLRVVGNVNNNELLFKIKRTTNFKRLMQVYCERQGISLESVRFIYDGDRLLPTQTPDELQMEDGDLIDVMVEQIGGFFGL